MEGNHRLSAYRSFALAGSRHDTDLESFIIPVLISIVPQQYREEFENSLVRTAEELPPGSRAFSSTISCIVATRIDQESGERVGHETLTFVDKVCTLFLPHSLSISKSCEEWAGGRARGAMGFKFVCIYIYFPDLFCPCIASMLASLRLLTVAGLGWTLAIRRLPLTTLR